MRLIRVGKSRNDSDSDSVPAWPLSTRKRLDFSSCRVVFFQAAPVPVPVPAGSTKITFRPNSKHSSQDVSFHSPTPAPGERMTTFNPSEPTGNVGMGSHILAKQTPETKGCGCHITLFLWFSNFILGQSKVSLPPAGCCVVPFLKMGQDVLGRDQQKVRVTNSQPGYRGLQGPQQMDQAPARGDSGSSPPQTGPASPPARAGGRPAQDWPMTFP